MPTDQIQSFRIEPSDLPDEALIFGSTAAMRDVRARIERILNGDLPVLIAGESGTGKEVVAKFLHSRSDRRELPFVKVNCAAIPAGFLESELLGGRGGGTAGAGSGWEEMVAGGTLFLDEVGDLRWEQQARLASRLQDAKFSRFSWGENRVGRARLICSSSRNLQKAVERRTFRADLFYRIEVIHLLLAPLRERKEDIPRLCRHFLEKLATRFGKLPPPLTEEALKRLLRSDWPGNLRELENHIARLVVLGDCCGMAARVDRLGETNWASDQGPRQTDDARNAQRRLALPRDRAAALALRGRIRRRGAATGGSNPSQRELLLKLGEKRFRQGRRSPGRRLPPERGTK
jgi:transcriptional regulator with PAS, ATPase and Fis domain